MFLWQGYVWVGMERGMGEGEWWRSDGGCGGWGMGMGMEEDGEGRGNGLEVVVCLIVQRSAA